MIPVCNQFQEEIIPPAGKWCMDRYHKKNICNGSKNDCITKGKEICLSDSKCFGIMYHSRWVSTYKGVMMCSSSTLQEKSEKDWSVFLKCDNGKYTSINSTYDKCLFSKNHFYCFFWIWLQKLQIIVKLVRYRSLDTWIYLGRYI